jgi:hypothetical protein
MIFTPYVHIIFIILILIIIFIILIIIIVIIIIYKMQKLNLERIKFLFDLNGYLVIKNVLSKE